MQLLAQLLKAQDDSDAAVVDEISRLEAACVTLDGGNAELLEKSAALERDIAAAQAAERSDSTSEPEAEPGGGTAEASSAAAENMGDELLE